jgi:hypothetical protein
MAFSSTGLKSVLRGDSTSHVKTGWLYKSADTIATIKGGNYFNSMAASMTVGDVILAVGASVPALLTVSSNTGTVVAVTESAGSGGGGGVGAGDIGTAELADNVVSANVLLGNDASGTAVEEITCTAPARTVLDDASVGAMLTTLGGQPLDTDLTAIAALTSAANKVPYATGSGTWAVADFSAAGRAVVDDADAAAQRVTLGLSTRAVAILIDGGGAVVPTGVYPAHIQWRTAATITAWRLLADQVGNIVVDVWSDTYANYPPTVADTITGSEKPTLTAQLTNQDGSLTTWTTAVAAGDIWRFNVSSASTLTWVTLLIEFTI